MALWFFTEPFFCLYRSYNRLKENLMEFGPEQFGKWLIVIGAVIAIFGIAMILLGKIGLFRLPGDIEFGSGNWKIYLPLASGVIISIILTLILWLITYLRR
jgi:hypothetical protein